MSAELAKACRFGSTVLSWKAVDDEVASLHMAHVELHLPIHSQCATVVRQRRSEHVGLSQRDLSQLANLSE